MFIYDKKDIGWKISNDIATWKPKRPEARCCFKTFFVSTSVCFLLFGFQESTHSLQPEGEHVALHACVLAYIAHFLRPVEHGLGPSGFVHVSLQVKDLMLLDFVRQKHWTCRVRHGTVYGWFVSRGRAHLSLPCGTEGAQGHIPQIRDP